MAILLSTSSLSRADEADLLAKLKVEKAALEQHLKEVDTRIDEIQGAQGLNWLGMTLVDSTDELMKKYGLLAEYPGPIIVKVHNDSAFQDGCAPTAGCAFWIVEHPVRGFLLNQENKEKAPSYGPRNVRELAQSLLLCTVTPEEYQAICNQTSQQAREYAETLNDKPTERERWLKIAEAKMPQEDVGKYICRVVYHYSETKKRGTMTTHIRMTKADLDQLRKFLKE